MSNRLSLNRLVYILPLIISILAPVLIITRSGFAYLGVAVSIASLATMIYFVRLNKTRYDNALFVSILLLCVFIVLRGNPFLVFLNIGATFFLGSTLATKSHKFTFLSSIILPLRLLFDALKQKPNYKEYSTSQMSTYVKQLLSCFESLMSIAITIVLLLIIIPILQSANPFFDTLIKHIVSSLHLGSFLDYFFGDNIPLHIARFIFFLVLVVLLPRLYSFIRNNAVISDRSLPLSTLRLLLPKITIGFVIAVFLFTQIQLYTASAFVLQEMGYTNSQQTREVFGQLAVVSIIIFFLIYNDNEKKKRDRILSYLLLTEGLFLTGMAFKSVFDYSSLFGFTLKRLYGFAGVLWLTGLYSGFVYIYRKDLNKSLFVKSVILWTTVVLIGINIANFDYLIAHVRPAHVEGGVDYSYILFNTSTDAQAYEMIIDNLYRNADNSHPDNDYLLSFTIYQIRYLQEKFGSGLDLRSFNISEYQEYLRIKDINVVEIENELYK